MCDACNTFNASDSCDACDTCNACLNVFLDTCDTCGTHPLLILLLVLEANLLARHTQMHRSRDTDLHMHPMPTTIATSENTMRLQAHHQMRSHTRNPVDEARPSGLMASKRTYVVSMQVLFASENMSSVTSDCGKQLVVHHRLQTMTPNTKTNTIDHSWHVNRIWGMSVL